MKVVLGLGSNLGNRRENLSKALTALNGVLDGIEVSPLYESDAFLPDHAPSSWEKPFLNCAVSGEPKGFSPKEFLEKVKKIEMELGRGEGKRWAPRLIDIDILIWKNEIRSEGSLKIPHPGLLDRPFALWPLTDLLPHWKYVGPGKDQGKSLLSLSEKWGTPSLLGDNAPGRTRRIEEESWPPRGVSLREKKDLGVTWVGILNVTPDSFSDGGKYEDPAKARNQALLLLAEGAHIIDVGAESTRPGAVRLSPEEEWLRLEPVLKALRRSEGEFVPISLDTRHPDTVLKALENYEVDWINDVTGLENPEMVEVLKNSGCRVVFMHNLGVPPSQTQVLRSDKDPVSQIRIWAKERIQSLEQVGIAKERLIFDPGIGFGKTAAQSWEILRRADEFKVLGCEILIGHSRKSFLNQVTGRSFGDRDALSSQISAHLAKKGMDYIRVHNIATHREAVHAESFL